MSPPGLFEGPAPRLRATPASAPFLDVLAGAMADALDPARDPFALADALVLLPNRRAARGLIDAFAKRLGGAALLPSIRPLGDLGDEVEVWGADPIALDVAPAIDPLRQQLELAALIRARESAEGGVADPARAIALADELRKLMESAAAAERVRWEALPTLVEEAELARHWEASARFLGIVSDYWPQRLRAEGLADPAARRTALLHALALEWRANPPKRPIVIAGSTGSIAATRALMAAAAALPRGVVVLPGLDAGLDDETWAAIADQHPQFALKHTLAALGVDRRDVPALGAETSRGAARRTLMREALAPAERTADWLIRLSDAGGAAFVKAGAEGVRLIEPETEEEEAACIALLLREAVEHNRTAALVTPDAGLARRVEAKLARWGIAPAVSHGRPLRETPAGVLIALLCELAHDPAEPVALAALLKHPLAARDSGLRTALEHQALRGPRRHESLDDLAHLIQPRSKAPSEKELAWVESVRGYIARVQAGLAPLAEAMARPALTLDAFADALTQAAEAMAGARVWAGADGEAAAAMLRDVIAMGGELGAMAPGFAPRVLVALMAGREVPPPPGGDPRVAVWGPLEARLQRRDLMVLAGLNEGVWPAPPPEDPFLSRAMRDKLGLPSVDQRIGLAAHDFAQLVGGADVVLTRALRRDGAPTLASRWLWRLKTLMKGAGETFEGAPQVLGWARALEAPPAQRAAKPPRPRPAPDARLKRISVTRVEELIRDPYAVYARNILGLDVLKPIGAPAGPAERGIAIHAALEAFEDGENPDVLAHLLDEHLRLAGVGADRRAGERARLTHSVRAFMAWLGARRSAGRAVYREKRGELPLACGVTLSGVADRIEIGADGAAILDFKTGAAPKDAQVASGLSPQLPLEAAMLARGAFADTPRATASELIYWRLGNADPAPRILDLPRGPHGAGEEALAALETMLCAYAEAGQPFLSKPRVQFIRRYADYDHLARRKEWADAEGEE